MPSTTPQTRLTKQRFPRLQKLSRRYLQVFRRGAFHFLPKGATPTRLTNRNHRHRKVKVPPIHHKVNPSAIRSMRFRGVHHPLKVRLTNKVGNRPNPMANLLRRQRNVFLAIVRRRTTEIRVQAIFRNKGGRCNPLGLIFRVKDIGRRGLIRTRHRVRVLFGGDRFVKDVPIRPCFPSTRSVKPIGRLQGRFRRVPHRDRILHLLKVSTRPYMVIRTRLNHPNKFTFHGLCRVVPRAIHKQAIMANPRHQFPCHRTTNLHRNPMFIHNTTRRVCVEFCRDRRFCLLEFKTPRTTLTTTISNAISSL